MAGNIKVQPVYKPLYTNTEKFIILMTGGRGSGKSYNASTFIERLTFQAGHKVLFSRYTMTAANISVIPEFEQKILLDGFGSNFQSTKTDIKNTFSGSEILFRGIKTSSGNQTANLKSIQGITTFVGDEMEEWQDEESFDTLRLSIRQKGIQNRCILLMNPSNADHFVYKKYIENSHRIEYFDGVPVQISTHPDVLHIHTTYLDNADNLGEQFLNEIESIRKESVKQATVNGVFDEKLFQKTKYAYKIIGRWADVAEGVIFENWKEGEFDTSLPYCFGADYGFSIDPDTLVKVAVNHRAKQVHIHECYYERKQLSTDGLADMYKSRIDKPNDLIVADSAEPRLIADIKKKGLNIVECEKGPGSVVAGITALLDYEIIVTPESHNVKKELRQYNWNDKKAGIPVDDWNHAIDPLRYAFKQLSRPKSNTSILSNFR